MDMEAPAPKGTVYRFDCFTPDLVRGALLAAGGTEIVLRPKAFALLRHISKTTVFAPKRSKKEIIEDDLDLPFCIAHWQTHSPLRITELLRPLYVI
jgi:hypothetical protein